MELTRRALLGAAAAGASSALFACRAKRRPITGRIVGGSDLRGHRLRAPRAPSSALPTEDVPVAILGGGIAGLAAAWKLAKHGANDFVLLELEDELGGNAIGGENAVTRHPWGAHYVPVPARAQRTLCELLHEVGAIDGFDERGRARALAPHLLRAPEERVFVAAEWSEGLYPRDGATASDLGELDRFEELVDELRARVDDDGKPWFTIPLAQGSSGAGVRALDALSMAQWLDQRGLASARLRWWIEYACRDDFGARLDTTSAFAALHYFCSRSRPEDAHGTHYLTWPEGNAFLARHMARAAEGRVRAGCVVTSVENGADGVVVRWFDERTASERALRCERVICALPRFVAQHVVPELASERRLWRATPWVVANVTLRERPSSRGFPLAWDNVILGSESLGYVVATHQLDRAERRDVWTWYRPFPDADVGASRAAVLARGIESWRDELMRDLAPAHRGFDDLVESIDAWRFGHAMARPEPGLVFAPERLDAARARGRIHFAHTDLSLLPLFEEAQWHGVRAAEEVLAARGIAFSSSL